MSDAGTPQYGGQQPPPQWGQQPPPGYGYAAPPTTSTNAILALVFAIGSFVICPIVPAIVALAVFVPKAREEIASSGGRVGGEGLVSAAKIVSWVHFALFGVFLLFFVFIVVVGAATSTSSLGAL